MWDVDKSLLRSALVIHGQIIVSWFLLSEGKPRIGWLSLNTGQDTIIQIISHYSWNKLLEDQHHIC